MTRLPREYAREMRERQEAARVAALALRAAGHAARATPDGMVMMTADEALRVALALSREDD